MKKFFSLKVGIIAGALAVLLAATLAPLFAGANPSTIFFETQATATTSPTYLVIGTATSTTYQLDSSQPLSSGKIANLVAVDGVSLYVQLTASTSATTVTITPQFSNNGIDWYGYNAPISASIGAGGANQMASSTQSYVWTPGSTTASTSDMVFNLPAVPTAHERVQFSISGANGAVYSETDLKQLPQSNP